MRHDREFDATRERFQALLEEGALHPQLEQQTRMLIERVDAPSRIAVFGPTASGRSGAIEALAGCNLAAELADCPVVELKHSTSEEIVATFASGKERRIDMAAQGRDVQRAVMVSVRQPSQRLKRKQVLSVVTDEGESDLHAALAWASRRADVFIWWFDRFSKRELSVWLNAPAKVKDHSILVLSGPEAEAQAKRLRKGLSVGFLDVIAIPSGEVQAKGLTQLKDVLDHHLHLAREEDADALQLLLRRVESDAKTIRLRGEDARPGAKSRAKPWARESDTLATTDDQARPEPVRKLEPSIGAPANPLSLKCIAKLRERAAEMGERVFGPDAPDEVVPFCLETVQSLIDLLDEEDAADAPGVDGIHDLLASAENLLMLLSVEDGDTAKKDALSVLLQLRTDFECGPFALARPETTGVSVEWAAQ